MGETYFDNPETYDWEKEEGLAQISVHDELWKCICSVTLNNTVYDLEATVTYSCGNIVKVEDIETLNSEPVGREPEDA